MAFVLTAGLALVLSWVALLCDLMDIDEELADAPQLPKLDRWLRKYIK